MLKVHGKRLLRITLASIVALSILGMTVGLSMLGTIERAQNIDVPREVYRIKSVLMQRTQAVSEIDFSAAWHAQRGEELANPRTLVPEERLLAERALTTLIEQGEKCSTLLNTAQLGQSDPRLRKLRTWYLHSCFQAPLSDAFFFEAPYVHPLGGSWVAWAYKHSVNRPGDDWLRTHKSLLHLLELGLLPEELLDPREKVLSMLRPSELGALINGDDFVLGSRFVFLLYRAKQGQSIYRAYRIRDWQLMIGSSHLRAEERGSGQCLMRDGQVCWTLANSVAAERRFQWIGISLASLILLSASVGIIAWLRKKEYGLIQRDHELIVETLAHELRHPATSLQLSLEVLRQRLDDFTEPEKVELLRMCDQTQRLQRLINASRQYLGSRNEPGSPFRFNLLTVPSLNEFFEDVIEPYRSKIQFTPLIEDSDGVVDPYWLAMCVTNLIKNALIHGASPINVEIARSGDRLRISVEDAGDLPSGNLENLKSRHFTGAREGGLGLGLSLVDRISRLMGGELLLETHPKKCFAIVMEVGRASRLAG